jgi:hydroxyacylglutathione hydrolase
LRQPGIHQFICIEDNYGVLVHNAETGETASIDAPDASRILAELDQKGWKLSHLLITHHHADHVQGLERLKSETGCTVIGPANPAIVGIDRHVGDGDRIELLGDEVVVIATPGHTLDMVNYHFTRAGAVFTGDTLFAMGCGRIFEGTAHQMWGSLLKLARLPAETRVYCGHEYTLSNARFALKIDPDNTLLQARAREVERLRAENLMTLPTTVELELATNPFLRASSRAIRKTLGLEEAADAAVFAEIRERKNRG